MTSRLDELFAGLPIRLDVQDVADLLGMTKKGVYRWINEGTIPGYKIGGQWIILRDELRDTLLQGSNVTHSSSPAHDETREPGENTAGQD